MFCLFARDAYRLVDQQLPCSRKVVALAEVSTHPAVRPNCTARPTKIVGTCHTKKKSGIHRMKPRTAPYFRWLLGPAPFPHPCTFSHPTTIHTPTAGILRGPPPLWAASLTHADLAYFFSSLFSCCSSRSPLLFPSRSNSHSFNNLLTLSRPADYGAAALPSPILFFELQFVHFLHDNPRAPLSLLQSFLPPVHSIQFNSTRLHCSQPCTPAASSQLRNHVQKS